MKPNTEVVDVLRDFPFLSSDVSALKEDFLIINNNSCLFPK